MSSVDTVADIFVNSRDDGGGGAVQALEDVAGTRHALTAMSHLLRRLYTRDARRQFCEPDREHSAIALQQLLLV